MLSPLLQSQRMPAISFKDTRLLKRGVYLTAVAMLSCLVGPALLNGSLWSNPVPLAAACAVLVSAFALFLRKTQMHRLADEVRDGGDHLVVVRGRNQLKIGFASIAMVGVSTGSGIHRITVRLQPSAKSGTTIEFLPQASLWSNLPRIDRLASSLNERAGGAA